MNAVLSNDRLQSPDEMIDVLNEALEKGDSADLFGAMCAVAEAKGLKRESIEPLPQNASMGVYLGVVSRNVSNLGFRLTVEAL